MYFFLKRGTVRDVEQSTSDSDNLCGKNTSFSHMQQFSKERKPF